MGFFSWKTTDTNRSIWNNCTNRCFTVYMFDNLGNVYEEKSYEGYGVFGKKDYFVLFAEMNGLVPEGLEYNKLVDEEKYGENDLSGYSENADRVRSIGINAYYDDTKNKDYIYPNLVQSKRDWEWINKKPIKCEHQGYFGCNSDPEEEDW